MALQINEVFKPNFICEPHLGKYNLTPTLNVRSLPKNMLPRHFLAYCDGARDVLDIANIIGCKASELADIIKICLENNLITKG